MQANDSMIICFTHMQLLEGKVLNVSIVRRISCLLGGERIITRKWETSKTCSTISQVYQDGEKTVFCLGKCLLLVAI